MNGREILFAEKERMERRDRRGGEVSGARQ